MHPIFRIVALTAALAAVPPAAFAAQVSLNFNNLGALAEAAGAPVAVPDMEGLNFSGAYGYGERMLDNGVDPENLDLASAGRGGFLLNVARGQSTSDSIIITLVQNAANARALTPTVFFQAVTFNLFTKGTGNSNLLYGIGVNGQDGGRQMTGGGQDSWTSQPIFTFSDTDQVTSLKFTAGGAAFALDDMVITLTDATDPGGSVPEPASYGLVGLALLGAGAASRRRQRG